MTQCPSCHRTIGFKAANDLCGTCLAREYDASALQRESELFYSFAEYYRDHHRRLSAIECQQSAADYAARARSILGITEHPQ